MADFVKSGAKLHPVTGDPAERNRLRIQKMLDNTGQESVEAIAQELKTTMTDKCGIFRNSQDLQEVSEKIRDLQGRFKNAQVMDKSRRFNTDVLATLEAEHLLTFSEVIIAGALARTESRGAHFRTDCPKRDDENWLKHTLAKKRDGEEPVLGYKSVWIDWDRYPPQERKY